MPLKDYLEFVEPLQLPCAGKTYALPPVGVKDAVTIVQGLDSGSGVSMTDEELARILLGPTLEQMRADNVPAGFITKAVLTALADFRNGRAAAEEFWDAVTDPKALMDLISRTPAQESKPSTSTAAARKTPKRASGTTTKTSRPSSPRSTKTPASPSAGSKSSTSGRSSKRASTPSSVSTS